MVEDIDAGAAGETGIDNMRAAADSAEEFRRLRAIHNDAVDTRHGGEMAGPAVVGDQDIGQCIKNQQLSQGSFSSQTYGPG